MRQYARQTSFHNLRTCLQAEARTEVINVTLKGEHPVTRKYTGGTRFSDGCLPVVRRVEDNQIASIEFPVVARILSTTCRRRTGTGRRGGPRSTQAIYTGNQLYTTVNERR